MKKERRTETCDVTTCNIYEMEWKLNQIKDGKISAIFSS